MSGFGASRYSRKISLSIFFCLELVAFTLCLIAILSPTWQFVYLENGRTEHHHGLWLDCKRDYSFDYGRTREYYETLYRRDLQGSPFSVFYLPPLQCVYKFDYWIDPEDLYDHDHDENRIQNDAWQHLFLGWKIAALAACGISVLLSAASLLAGICSFCHRTFICASTVLVTIAAIMSVVGITVFYMWANYQDNKVIKEEDNVIYEQQFGWAFEFQVVGTILHWIASFLGCFATSLAFQKGRAKLVKIEVVEGNDDDTSLLGSSQSSNQKFKRSLSAVYRVDTEALRRWEKDYMKNIKNGGRGNNFKRTSSVPNFTKSRRSSKAEKELNRSRPDLFTSTSNVFSEKTTSTGISMELSGISMNTLPRQRHEEQAKAVQSPKSILKSAQNVSQPVDLEQTYEYLPCDSSIGISTFKGGSTLNRPKDPSIYDSVYNDDQFANEYLQPSSQQRNSSSTISTELGRKALMPSMQPVSGSAQSIPTPKTTLIDDVAERPASSMDRTRVREQITREKQTIEELRRIQLMREREKNKQYREKQTSEFPVTFSTGKISEKCETVLPVHQPSIPPLNVRDIGRSVEPIRGYAHVETSRIMDSTQERDGQRINDNKKKPTPPSTPWKPTSQRETTLPVSFFNLPSQSDDSPRPNSTIAINTFGDKGASRSIQSLSMRAAAPPSTAQLFERPDSVALSSVSSNSLRKKLLSRTHLHTIPDEVDRSVGSSTLVDTDCLRSDSPSSTYVRDAEVRLNLFLNDTMESKDSETTV